MLHVTHKHLHIFHVKFVLLLILGKIARHFSIYVAMSALLPFALVCNLWLFKLYSHLLLLVCDKSLLSHNSLDQVCGCELVHVQAKQADETCLVSFSLQMHSGTIFLWCKGGLSPIWHNHVSPLELKSNHSWVSRAIDDFIKANRMFWYFKSIKTIVFCNECSRKTSMVVSLQLPWLFPNGVWPVCAAVVTNMPLFPHFYLRIKRKLRKQTKLSGKK